MNFKSLALGAAVAAFTLTSFAAEPLLSPRAAGNQLKTVDSAKVSATTTVISTDTSATLLSPRAQGNQIKVLKGVVNEQTPALNCYRTMNGAPRAIAECSSHANMPVCMAASR